MLDGERIRGLLSEANSSNTNLDKTTLEFLLRHRLEALSRHFAGDPNSLEKIEHLQQALDIVRQMPFPVNLWSVQNDVYAVQGTLYPRIRRRAQRNDPKAEGWLTAYLKLNESLSIQVR